MGETSSTSEEVTPTAIKIDELRARDKERREDIARQEKDLTAVRLEIRTVGAHVMMLWWGVALLFVVNAVGFLSIHWK